MSKKRKITGGTAGYSNAQLHDKTIFVINGVGADWIGNYLPLFADNNTTPQTTADLTNPGVFVMTTPGHLSELLVHGSNTTLDQGETFTLYVNGAETTLTVTVPSGSTTASNITKRVKVNVGDLVCMYYDAGSTGDFNEVAVSLRLIPD